MSWVVWSLHWAICLSICICSYINPIRPGEGIFLSPPRVNLMASFLGWSKNFQLLVVFQVETSINFWWSQIFGLLWNLFQNWASKTPSRPDFRAKNAFFHFLSIFCITNHAFSSWIWILYTITFLLRYITSFLVKIWIFEFFRVKNR